MTGPWTGQEILALLGAEQASDDELDDALTETWDRIAAARICTDADRNELMQDLQEHGVVSLVIARRIGALT